MHMPVLSRFLMFFPVPRGQMVILHIPWSGEAEQRSLLRAEFPPRPSPRRPGPALAWVCAVCAAALGLALVLRGEKAGRNVANRKEARRFSECIVIGIDYNYGHVK